MLSKDINFELLRHWLQVCDEEHKCHSKANFILPTRVLEVKDSKSRNILRLRCTKNGDTGSYIALSHRWGEIKEDQKFCTSAKNIEALCEGIDINKFPTTFQDAVKVTRELGVQFLWIDSLCIIQDDAEDWERESKRMEDVFSSAYCTIAASSAKDSTDGFLGSRLEGQYISVRGPPDWPPDCPLYICEAMDNFHRDVEEGKLNQRGWVLQERALSRRTIHFTSTQIYWVCGVGVRCETLTLMHK